MVKHKDSVSAPICCEVLMDLKTSTVRSNNGNVYYNHIFQCRECGGIVSQ